jgi:hypothetical protein
MPIIGILDGSGDTVGAPTIGTATAGNTTASVTFTPPTYTGKGGINYIATSSPGGFTATSATSPIVVTGLTNGTSYTFTVYGLTDYGIQSASSAASNAVTPFAPPVCPPAGQFVGSSCSGTTLIYNYTDGSCGTYPVSQGQVAGQCGYNPPPPPPSCPAYGTFIAQACGGYNGFTLYNELADGNCGSFYQLVANNSPTCGYVPAPACVCCVGVSVSDSQCCPPSRLYQRSGVSYNGSCGASGVSGTGCGGYCEGCDCPAFIAWGGWQFVQSGYCYPGGCTYAPCYC